MPRATLAIATNTEIAKRRAHGMFGRTAVRASGHLRGIGRAAEKLQRAVPLALRRSGRNEPRNEDTAGSRLAPELRRRSGQSAEHGDQTKVDAQSFIRLEAPLQFCQERFSSSRAHFSKKMRWRLDMVHVAPRPTEATAPNISCHAPREAASTSPRSPEPAASSTPTSGRRQNSPDIAPSSRI